MKKILATILSLTIMAGAFTACGNNNNETSSTNAESTNGEKENSNLENTNSENDESESSESGESDVNKEEIRNNYLSVANEVKVTDTDVTFKDDSGRESITINKNLKNVAVLYGSHACLWYEAGATAQGCVGGKSNTALYLEQIGRDIAEDEGMNVLATSGSGKSWDIEKILAMKPDLIVCSTAMNGYATIQGPAEAANIPVIAMKYSGLGDYLKWFKVFSNVSGDPALWDTVAMSTLDSVVDTISKVPADKSPRVLSLMPMKEGPAEANLKGSDMGVILNELGATNVADKLGVGDSAVRIEISLETIFAENPEIILVQCLGSEEEAKATIEAQFGENPVWKELDAVKNNKVYYMPKALFHNRPNSKYSESYKMMAEILYPDVEF